jgi:hypothetical protein
MPIITITTVHFRNGKSDPGHAFISFNNESGEVPGTTVSKSYGFYPQGSNLTDPLFIPYVRTPGDVRQTDNLTFLTDIGDPDTLARLHVEVSQAEYDAMKAFVQSEIGLFGRQYDFFGADKTDPAARNCVTWVNEVLRQVGLGVNTRTYLKIVVDASMSS